MALLAAQVSKNAPPMAAVIPDVVLPDGFENLVRSLMAKNATDRPQSAGDVTHELLRLARRGGFGGIHDPLAGTETPLPTPPAHVAIGPGGTDVNLQPVTAAQVPETAAEPETPTPIISSADPAEAAAEDVFESSAPPPSHEMPAVGREWPTIHRKGGGAVVLESVSDLQAVAAKAQESGGPMPLAGSGTPGHSGDGGPANSAQLCEPVAVGQDVHGNLFIVERGSHCVRFIDAREGTVQTVAGSPEESGFGGDDGPADIALLDEPGDIVADAMGNLYIADTGNRRVRAIDVRSGHIGTVVGSGRATAAMEGAPAHLAGVVPTALAIGPDGALVIADAENHRVWRVDPQDGTIRTAAGTGEPSAEGDGLNSPRDVAFSPDGTLYIADTGNGRVCRIAPHTGLLEPIAGGDDGSLGTPVAVTTTRAGHLRIADSTGGRVLALDPTPDASAAPYPVATDLAEPRGLMVDGQGTLYIADAGRHRVWAVIEPD